MPRNFASDAHGVQYVDEKAENIAHGDPVDARTMSFKVGASVMAGLLVIVMVSAAQEVQPRSSIRKLSFEDENASSHKPTGSTLNVSNIGGNRTLTIRPWPRYPAVSTIQFCNYAPQRVFPSYWQAKGTVNGYTISGRVVPYMNSLCFMFSSDLVAYNGINGAIMEGYYLRDGGSEEPWRRCVGGGFELQKNSRYAGEFACRGSPPVCYNNNVFVYRSSR